jgi:hypothetical protein
MDKKELKKRIEQVAIIKDLSPKKDPNVRLNDGVDEHVRNGDEWVEINSKFNPTLGFQFIKLKEQHRSCEIGCGKIVTDQIIERRLAFTPEKHWRTRCNSCGLYVSPDGQGFIEGGHAAAAAFLRHFNKLKGIETAEKAVKVNPETNQQYEEIINNDSIIRVYK